MVAIYQDTLRQGKGISSLRPEDIEQQVHKPLKFFAEFDLKPLEDSSGDGEDDEGISS